MPCCSLCGCIRRRLYPGAGPGASRKGASCRVPPPPRPLLELGAMVLTGAFSGPWGRGWFTGTTKTDARFLCVHHPVCVFVIPMRLEAP